jgi:heterodisulfide reductase subunit A2
VDLIRVAVAKVRHNRALAPIQVSVTREVLVVGGKMAGLSETFPTLDCSQCILTPRMVEVAQYPNITLYTCSEVEQVEGYVGNFRVTIRKRARYIDIDKCTGCGQCWNVCLSKKTLSEFDYGLGARTAIYAPFPQPFRLGR